MGKGQLFGDNGKAASEARPLSSECLSSSQVDIAFALLTVDTFLSFFFTPYPNSWAENLSGKEADSSIVSNTAKLVVRAGKEILGKGRWRRSRETTSGDDEGGRCDLGNHMPFRHCKAVIAPNEDEKGDCCDVAGRRGRSSRSPRQPI